MRVEGSGRREKRGSELREGRKGRGGSCGGRVYIKNHKKVIAWITSPK